MGVDFYPCKGGCGGTYTTCDDYFTCEVCDKGACKHCGKDWSVIEADDYESERGVTPRVCDACVQVDVSEQAVFDELLKIYRQLPGADPTLTFDTLEERLQQGKATPYAEWKRKYSVKTLSDAEEEESLLDAQKESHSDAEEDESLEDSSPPPKKVKTQDT